MFYKQVQRINKSSSLAKAQQVRNFSVVGNASQAQDNAKATSRIGDYTVIDHTYDAIVVGAGGAGLRVSTKYSIFQILLNHVLFDMLTASDSSQLSA